MRSESRPWLRLAAACATSVLLGGCVTNLVLHRIQEPPNLAVLDAAGTTRERVAKEFGEPVRQHDNVSTYRYFVPDKRHSPLFLPMAMFFEVYTLGLYGRQAQQLLKAGMRETNVAYAPNGRVIDWWHERTDRGAASDFREWLDSGCDDEKLDRLMAAARAGYAPAHFAMALRYRYAIWGAEPDRVSAFKWARLAAYGGHAAARDAVNAWGPELSPEQLALADRSVRTWPDEPEGR